MATKDTAPAVEPEVTEYPVTIDEFLSEIPTAKVESKAAFKTIMAVEGYAGSKLRSEWSDLFETLNTKPTAIPWKEWIGTKGGK